MARLLLTPAIVCALAGALPATSGPIDGDDHRHGQRPHGSMTRNAPINLIDPVNGAMVDTRMDPVQISARVDGIRVSIPIGVSTLVSAISLLEANEATAALFIQAAQQNRMVAEQKVVSPTMHQ